VLLLAGSRGGKSVLLCEIITNALATVRKLRVRAVDYGNSLEPLVSALGGRHLTFDPKHKRTINIWDYAGLEQGAMPSELQIWYVVQDAMQLARVDGGDTFAEDILTLMVRQVYANEVSRNGDGRPKHEPRHEHLLEMLRVYEFDDAEAERHGVSELNSQIADTKALAETIRAQINELTEKINEKMIKYGVVINRHVNFGQRVQQDTAAWAEMTRVNEEGTKT